MVEEYWNDVTVYCVEFISLDEEHNHRKHRKILVFNDRVTKDNIRSMMKTYFKNIFEVTAIDEWSEALCLKDSLYSN